MESPEVKDLGQEIGKVDIDIPQNHFEGMDVQDGVAYESLAENVFKREVADYKGILNEWKSICKEESYEEIFKNSYTEYLLAPTDLKENAPDKYEFIKEKVFFGKEFLDSNLSSQINKDITHINNKDTRDVSFKGYNTTMGTTTPSGCDSWARNGGYISCWVSS
ncbi:MAG: hypothetical protein AB2421_02695 [Thermotaleaceae bacterium]